tara:strand:+ start:139 stop:783 length:645 start_codon:yes stop_codon:yes gene_type:complete
MLKEHEIWWEKTLNNSYRQKGIKKKAPTLESFGTWMGEKDSKDRKFVRTLFKGDTLLDAGCGVCPEYFGLSESNINIDYTGVDITPKIVEYNKSKGINCIQGSLMNLPFDNNIFDTTHSRHVLEHMSEVEQPLNEMIRVSKQRVINVFFINFSTREFEHDIKKIQMGTEVYHNAYNRIKIEQLLKNNPKVKSFKWFEGEEIQDTMTTSILCIDL